MLLTCRGPQLRIIIPKVKEGACMDSEYVDFFVERFGCPLKRMLTLCILVCASMNNEHLSSFVSLIFTIGRYDLHLLMLQNGVLVCKCLMRARSAEKSESMSKHLSDSVNLFSINAIPLPNSSLITKPACFS